MRYLYAVADADARRNIQLWTCQTGVESREERGIEREKTKGWLREIERTAAKNPWYRISMHK